MFSFLKNFFSRKPNKVTTPSILQMEAVECGAASLAMILAYYKKFVSLAELRIACGVSRDGSKASGILKAAESYGLKGDGYSLEVDDLKELEPPYIVFWDFNHFVVVDGIKKNKVYLNDPAYGPRVLTLEEFEESFTGVVLAFEPTDEFIPSGTKPQLLPSLLRRLKGHRRTLLFLLLIAAILFIPGLLLPVFIKIFIDEVLMAHNSSFVLPLLVGIAIAGSFGFVVNLIRSYLINKFETFLSLKESAIFLWHILNLPVVFFSQRSSGDILNRAQTAHTIANILAHDVIETFLSVLTVCLFSTIMFAFSPLLTVISISIALLNVVVLKLSSRVQINLNQSIANEDGKWHGMGVNSLQMIETVKASGLEKDLFSSWVGQFTKLFNLQQDLTRLSNILSSIFYFFPQLNIIVILGLGGYLVLHGQITLGTLIAFQSLSSSLMHPFENLAQIMTKIQVMHGEMNRLDDVLLYPAENLLNSEAKPQDRGRDDGGKSKAGKLDNSIVQADNFKGHISFQNLVFGYSKDQKPIINNFNLELTPGKWVAIVGASCSGRSSIARLAMGLYQPWSGDILLDGKTRSHFSKSALSHSLSYVSQEIVLFEGTVRENLTMWNPQIKFDDIIAAAKDAQAHNIILNRPDGYDTAIQENGSNFSGGEKQRLEVARALATNPTALILDEATSALDAVSENNLIKSIKKRNCSCLIISHRLSIIKECDEILVIENGDIVQRGTYNQLLKETNSLFLRLLSYE